METNSRNLTREYFLGCLPVLGMILLLAIEAIVVYGIISILYLGAGNDLMEFLIICAKLFGPMFVGLIVFINLKGIRSFVQFGFGMVDDFETYDSITRLILAFFTFGPLLAVAYGYLVVTHSVMFFIIGLVVALIVMAISTGWINYVRTERYYQAHPRLNLDSESD